MTWVALYLLDAAAVFAWLLSDRSTDGPIAIVVLLALGWLPALALILLMVVVSLIIALWQRVGCG